MKRGDDFEFIEIPYGDGWKLAWLQLTHSAHVNWLVCCKVQLLTPMGRTVSGEAIMENGASAFHRAVSESMGAASPDFDELLELYQEVTE